MTLITNKSNQLRVINFEPHLVQIEIIDFSKWKLENTDKDIKIGSFLKVEDGTGKNILVLVKSFKMKSKYDDSDEGDAQEIGEYPGTFIINTQPIGQLECIDGITKFVKGIKNISIPPNGVNLASDDEIKSIFSVDEKERLVFAEHLINPEIKIEMNGNKFFSKHLAVVGSTGSGKSCTVTKIIQEAKKLAQEQESNNTLNNTHIIIFDIHGEYKKAFPDANYLSVEENTLHLPYWLMNSEELEDMFIESNETNSHNQVSQFKYAVTKNKEKHNPNIKVTYDSPVYFSLDEVYNYIYNKNNLTTYEKGSKTLFAVLDSNVEYSDDLWAKMEFEQSTGTSKHPIFDVKVSKNGGFNGEFDRFISRLETKINDERLDFILKMKKDGKTEYETGDFKNIVERILGYTPDKGKKTQNITIIDLSSLPFEVVSIVVSIVSRITFDFAYYATRLLEHDKTNETPFMLVYEEAHKYIPKNEEVRYRNTRLAVERIAKEGRKYGVSAMIVSQRPSEISNTVFSQCNNFVVMRLNNPEDQSYVKRLLPEAVVSYGDALSSLEQREALIVGDAISTPVIARVQDANPTPKSNDIDFYTKWKDVWKNIAFDEIIKKINKTR